VDKIIAAAVLAFALWLGGQASAQSASNAEPGQFATGLTAHGCDGPARQTPPCRFDLTGPITRAQAEAFERFLARRTHLQGFDFEVTGTAGSVDAAMTFGTRLRERGAAVIAHGNCGTACVLVLAGGVHRSAREARVTVDHPYPDAAIELGEHRAERYIERINNPIATYLERMGIQGSLLAAMLAVPAGESRELSAAELRGFGLVGRAY
jgi:hypothetical protein